MIADPDWLPGDTSEDRLRSDNIYLRGRCNALDAARREAQSAALLWLVAAIWEAGVLVALAVARWRGAS